MLASYKDLCIDAADADAAGSFWALVLGRELRPGHRDNARLVGPTDAHTVWVNTVPEPKTVKHRVHLDVHCASIDDLVELGATVVDGTSFRWTVMADPEGGEFCAFVREEPPADLLYEISVDATDHESASAWWAGVLGGRREVDPGEGISWVEAIPGAPFESLVFAGVPEPKSAKNRVHLDLWGDPAELVAAGAAMVRARDDDIFWHVLADPEGNEFCVFERP